MRMFVPTRSLAVLSLLLAATAASAAPRPTVVVAPLASPSAEEYQWIGQALAESFTNRLLASGQANVFSQRQWAAVLRERDIEARSVRSDEDAREIGQQLGADQLVVGSFVASWPDIRISVRRLAIDGTRPLATAEVTGNLEDLPKLEGQLAKALFKGAFDKAAKGAGPTKSVYAWQRLARCRGTLALQSMGPRARPWLPRPLVERAVADCAEAEKLDKRLVEATAFRGLGLFLLGEEKEGRKATDSALKKRREPGWPDLVSFFVRLRGGDAAGAEKVLAAAIKKRPGFLHARTTLGESLAARGDPDGARKVFEQSLAEAPKQPWIHVQVSKLLAKKGDIDGAVAGMDKALAQVPDDAVLLMEKASRQIDGKRWKDAETTLRKAMESDPRLATAYLRLGFVFLETDQLALARPILEKALLEADLESEARVRGYAHFDLAKLAVREKRTDDAKTHIAQAIQAGFADRERFEKDADLAGLVKDPGVAAMFR
jgi:tetratricopeptide (TPR) repeat protein